MRAPLPRPTHPRRGVTLVEMLVVVALVILMMVILVQIFQSATGAMSASKATQELDVELRAFDLRLKQDLAGVTARFTPPLDPSLKLGYFEYGENAFADLQGEDTDDYIAFTTKAPEGQVFTGRVYVSSGTNLAVQPVTITSQLAEVVYFLRNGNLYRRVFLIVPDRPISTLPTSNNNLFAALSSNLPNGVSWIGVNDLSARPASVGPIPPATTSPLVLNDLGSLTNREYRAFRPRFRNDFFGSTNGPDGIDDDLNGDAISDFYPTLYPNVFNAGLVHEIAYPNPGRPYQGSFDVYAFPYIYPGMYSQPEPASSGTGWIHSLDPSHASYSNLFQGNHAPLAIGDNLLTPNPTVAAQHQTWWGFPTWRETLSPNWTDPLLGLNYGSTPSQQMGLKPFPPNILPGSNPFNLLPTVDNQFGNDTVGSISFAQCANNDPSAPNYSKSVKLLTTPPALGVWDDDLVLTNVRSFDIKAYDADAPLYINSPANVNNPPYLPFVPGGGYYDLGYGLMGNNSSLGTNAGLSLDTATPASLWGPDNQPQGFGHAGRMPPLTSDNRLNPSRPSVLNGINNNFVGDNGNNLPVTRLTRVWDSWSTDYTNAPDVDINLNGYPPQVPVYPSYPAPYTTPLRGIQIQIRVADPRGEHTKVLTIRQDFTDKL